MYALEFETDISGKTLMLPAEIASKINQGQHVRVIMLLDEAKPTQTTKTAVKNPLAALLESVEENTGVKSASKPFPPTRVEDGIGCVGYQGPRKSLEDMQQGIDAEARRQWQQEDRS